MKLSFLSSLLVSTVVSAAVVSRQGGEQTLGPIVGDWYGTGVSRNAYDWMTKGLAQVNLTMTCEKVKVVSTEQNAINLEETATLKRIDTQATADIHATGKVTIGQQDNNQNGIYTVDYSISEFTAKKSDWNRLYPGYSDDNSNGDSDTITVPGTAPLTVPAHVTFLSSQNNGVKDAIYLWIYGKDFPQQGAASVSDEVYSTLYTKTSSINDQVFETLKEQIPANAGGSDFIKAPNTCSN
ncbi:hypothetical protein EC973_009429 [Apophysomyces ossiformis]|uniref:Uncharacterized protein n=1 Tax=Apophysomyces ossiformis TaxID=679940 RepID=A0A8H7EQD2_9FUNG|nr:hypothetical protein EC973_009429 [Apophysomyces ossiformis]